MKKLMEYKIQSRAEHKQIQHVEKKRKKNVMVINHELFKYEYLICVTRKQALTESKLSSNF